MTELRLTQYWRKRRRLAYYTLAIEYIKQYAGDRKTLLEVGGGVTRGVRYLNQLPHWDRVSVELPSPERRQLPGVRVVEQDFLAWAPDRSYDVVMCLQVLEHVADPTAFAAKLFSCATRLVVISVPYQWKRGAEPTHSHDPVDRVKLKSWVGREPVQSRVVDAHPYRRLVAAYHANPV